MSTLPLQPLISQLSHELIMVCDQELVVREVNELAASMIGERIIGRPLLQLFSNMARPKAIAFINALLALDPGQVTATWELLLHMPRAAPLLVGLRGGRIGEGGWLLMGNGEPPRLTGLYHEVLALNTELTDLVRTLTREHAALAQQIERLMQEKEG